MLFLATFLVVFCQTNLQLKHRVVVLSVQLLCYLHGFLVAIESLIEFILTGEDVSGLRVELEEHFLVRDAILGQFEPPFGLRSILLVGAIKSGQTKAHP